MFTFFSQPKTASTTINTYTVAPDCQTCRAIERCKYGMQKPEKSGKRVAIVIDAPDSDTPDAIKRLPKKYGDLFARTGCTSALYQSTIVPASACPSAQENDWVHCQPLLVAAIRAQLPEAVIVLGYKALQSTINWLWGDVAGEPERWHGQMIPSRELNAWVFPVDWNRRFVNNQVSDIWAYRWLKNAASTVGRPYDTPPDYERQFTMARGAEELAAHRDKIREAVITSVDFETTGRKPEGDSHAIYSAAIAYTQAGKEPHCVAFQVTRDTEPFLVEYLKSPVRKIGANIKFEERWARRKLDTSIRNFCWDTVLAAHIDDPAKGVAGVKFQSFAKLGLRHYAHGMEKYFEGDGVNVTNKIYQADPAMVLRYNAIDALAELDLGILQMYVAGISDLWSPNLPHKRYYTNGKGHLYGP